MVNMPEHSERIGRIGDLSSLATRAGKIEHAHGREVPEKMQESANDVTVAVYRETGPVPPSIHRVFPLHGQGPCWFSQPGMTVSQSSISFSQFH